MGAVKPVLVVEGVDDVREVIADILSEVGYAVDARSGPEEALAVLRERGPDSVALVLARPIFSPGQEPYLWLDQLRAHTTAPVVITTRYPRDWFADYAARGYAGLLAEPFAMPELVSLARSLAPLRASVDRAGPAKPIPATDDAETGPR